MKRILLAVLLLAAPILAQAQTIAQAPWQYSSVGVNTLKHLAIAARRAEASNPWINPLMSNPPVLTLTGPWVTSKSYSVGQTVSTQSGSGPSASLYLYKCTTAGTSAASGSGPSGTSATISDGTAVWSYISNSPGAQYQGAAPNAWLWGAGSGKAGINGPVSFLGGLPINGAGNNVEITQSAYYTPSNYFSNNNGRLEFLTDSASPTIRLFSYAPSSYRVIVNGQFVSMTPVTTSLIGWTDLNINFGSRAMRDVIVVTDAGNGWFEGVDVSATENIYPAQHANQITMVGTGDSIIAGVGASYDSNGFFPIACDMLGVTNCIDGGIGGVGYSSNYASGTLVGTALQRIDNVIDMTSKYPNPVVVDENMFNDCSGSSSAIQSDVVSYIQGLRTAGFNGPIFEVGMFASNNGGNWISGLACDAGKLAAITQLNDPLVFWIPDMTAPAGSWFNGTGNTTAPNGSGNSDFYINGANLPHPGDAGHMFYAINFVNEVNQVLASY